MSTTNQPSTEATGSTPATARRLRARLRAGLAREAVAALKQTTIARSAALAVIAGWVAFTSKSLDELAYFEGLIAVFALLGIWHYVLVRRAGSFDWRAYAFIFADFALLTVTVIAPVPYETFASPPQLAFRGGNFAYVFVLLSGLLLSYSPRRVLWAGFSALVAWTTAVIVIATLPSTLTFSDMSAAALADPRQIIARFLEPNFVDINQRAQEAIILMIVTGIMAAAVWRVRRVLERQIISERERASLARYFSPNMVDALADHTDAMHAPRAQSVAVLFADIVGFTQMCAAMPAEQVVGLLRDYFDRLGQQVFDHNGTLDKFLGDGLMATFGTPNPAPDDAARALACAVAMIDTVEAWNDERRTAGAPPIQVSVGLHHGIAVVGDIGNARRLEFAVIGDTVNTASRVEELTRSLDARLAVTQALIDAVKIEPGAAQGLLGRLEDRGEHPIRGTEQTARVWTLA